MREKGQALDSRLLPNLKLLLHPVSFLAAYCRPRPVPRRPACQRPQVLEYDKGTSLAPLKHTVLIANKDINMYSDAQRLCAGCGGTR
jgi:hypothetical protein